MSAKADPNSAPRLARASLKRCMIVLIILVWIVGCLSGCSVSERNKRKAAKALQEKYNEEFQITNYRSGGFFGSYDSMMGHSVNYPELTFYLDISDSGQVSDSYVTARLCSRISEQICDNISGLEEEYYVYTQAMLPISYLSDPEVTVSEYLEEGPNKFWISLFIQHTDASEEEIVMALLPMMDGLKEVSGAVYIYFVDETMMDKVKEYITTHDKLYGEFGEMTEEVYIGSVPFENGGFSLTAYKLREMTAE